jgi:spermidine/putrescine transport system substrate-binding protein
MKIEKPCLHCLSLPAQLLTFMICLAILAACSTPGSPPPAPLRFYDWAEDIPEEVFAAFTQETGIPVEYLDYEAQEDAVDALRQGESFDVVVMDARFLPLLIEDGLLAPLDHSLLPNFKYIAPNFRDLAYDPGNRYSVPFNWGVTGLVVRSGSSAGSPLSWADLWDPQYAGKVGLWLSSRRELLGMALHSLGYSANSEDPDQLLAAQQRLNLLLPNAVIMEDFDAVDAAAAFQHADLAVAMAFAYDLYAIQETGIQVDFVMPQDGPLLWNDTFVVPDSSVQSTAAMQLINFLHRPEISAQIANYNGYATPNQGALSMVDEELLADASIYPSSQELSRSEIILPLSPAGQALHDRVWEELSRQIDWHETEMAP